MYLSIAKRSKVSLFYSRHDIPLEVHVRGWVYSDCHEGKKAKLLRYSQLSLFQTQNFPFLKDFFSIVSKYVLELMTYIELFNELILLFILKKEFWLF